MRIAIPVIGESVSASLTACEGIRFYEDDHGRITKQSRVAVTERGMDAVLSLLERSSVDALVCGALSDAEREELLLSGILCSPGASGSADAAALHFLGRTIVFDEKNSCNACGHGHACSMDCKSCSVSRANSEA